MHQIVTNGLSCATSFCERTKEAQMETLLSFATLLAATILALFVALGLHSLLLRAANWSCGKEQHHVRFAAFLDDFRPGPFRHCRNFSGLRRLHGYAPA